MDHSNPSKHTHTARRYSIKKNGTNRKGSLLYGELLPRGVNKAMGPKHLNAAKASTIYDLGMGTGKVAMQVFLQFPNLSRVYGIELSQGRFELGEAVRRSSNLLA